MNAIRAINCSLSQREASADVWPLCSRDVLAEAEQVWHLGKLLGLKYQGNEEEIIQKLAELEKRDMESQGEHGDVGIDGETEQSQ